MEHRKKFYRFALFLALFSVLLFATESHRAEARYSRAWREILAERTTTLWIEGEVFGDLVLNARGELNITWLERGLSTVLSNDNNVEEWVLNGINHYFSSRRDTRARMRNRDVLVLNYRARKRWTFDPTNLTVNGYAITPDDILTRDIHWESNLAPGEAGTLEVSIPALRPGQTVTLQFEDAEATFEVPRLRSR